MELAMAVVIGVMFAGGTYMILRPNLIRIVMGFGLYSNAANLLMIVCGGYTLAGKPPFITDGTSPAAMMDPFPPDIILTAIVISFAVGALMLIVSYCVYLDHGTDNPEKLPLFDPEESELGDGDSHGSASGDGVPDVLAELAKPNVHSPHERAINEARASG